MNANTFDNMKKVGIVLLFDIVYYVILLFIVFAAGIIFSSVLSGIEEHSFVLADYAFVEDFTGIGNRDLSRIKGASEGILGVGNQLLAAGFGIFLVVVVCASLFKGLGYSVLSRKKFSLRYFWKLILVNLVWRGIFLLVIFGGVFVVKPEMQAVFIGIVAGIFLLMTPVLYLILDEKTKFRGIFGKALRIFFSRFLSIAVIYSLALFSIYGLSLFLNFFKVPFTLVIMSAFGLVGISIGKLFLSREVSEKEYNVK